MEYPDGLIPEYTVRHLDFGISARCPVRVWSLMYSREAYRVLHFGDTPDHPGEAWGPVQHLTSEWDHVGLHDHDYCEITLIRGGHVSHRTARKTSSLRAQSVVVASPGHVHALENIHGLQETHISFLPNWLGDDLPNYWSEPALVPLFMGASLFPSPLYPAVPEFTLTAEESDLVDHGLILINRELGLRNPSLVFLKLTLLQCLIHLARAYVRHWPDGPHLPFRREVFQAMEDIERLVRSGGAVNVSELAERVGLSHKRLDTVFKKGAGLSPTEYGMRRRAQWAARMLLKPDTHITDVAMQCGYSDAAHLSKSFRRFYGMPPRRYRALYSAGGEPETEGNQA